jgi:hypothetical protein
MSTSVRAGSIGRRICSRPVRSRSMPAPVNRSTSISGARVEAPGAPPADVPMNGGKERARVRPRGAGIGGVAGRA